MRIATLITLGWASIACLSATTASAKDAALEKAIAGSHRTAKLVERDAARHPRATLEFFGIKPNSTVVEISPGAGYWTEILAPYLKKKGTFYTAIAPRASGERAAKSADSWQERLDANKEIYGKVKVSEFGKGVSAIAPENSADLVVTFRNVHNWMGAGYAEEAFETFFKALKPGGILGVEGHRASNAQPQDPKAQSGYVREDYAIALAEKAGFKLIEKSEVNANPKDTKDWPRGVWTLPPTLALGDQDREKYIAIGESDNFVLKFQKPR